ncbi:N-6 DNA methylase [Pendulispora brunnea]|uniref:site-specific DNA-methyltransferase (adenine-specific) n=1 Tax=Pendulispora brunnea TaxID=2905690 RepID=A0ABZ2KID8_9BACT
MARRIVRHAGLDAITDRTRNALALLAGGFRAPEGPVRPKALHAGLVAVVVRTVFLHVAGGLMDAPRTWEGLLQAFTRLDEELPAGDRLLGSFPFLSAAHVPDAIVERVLDELLHVERDELEVEHLGTVYESMMGYAIAVAEEPSLVVLCRRKAGDSQVGVLVGLASLLAQSPPSRKGSLRRRGIEMDEKLEAAIEQSTSIEELGAALRKRTAPLTPDLLPAGTLALTLTPDRRRSGSHYTPRALADQIVEDTLGPLIEALGEHPSSDAILRLKVCDPAMGSGAFLLAACRYLGGVLARAWHHENVPDAPSLAVLARRLVAEQCIYGVDKDASAVSVTKLSFRLLTEGGSTPKLRRGESLAGLDWSRQFPEVFAPPRAGFDAFVGNPPWISYAGRAAQPLDAKLYRYFTETYASFAGYRNLQGLFIERSASLLRPSGRLGFIIPSSMSEQEGYAPTRAAHDRLCICDANLRDLGNDAFSGVFQPCMALISTRRTEPAHETNGNGKAIWPIERTDLDPIGHALLRKMGAHPPLPPHLFGERGIQTSSGDVERMRDKPDGRRTLALRTGGDIEPFLRRAPSLYCDPERLSCRVRAGQEWSAVRVLIRQTARVPMATLSDGTAFRNSILAGFADEVYPATFLAAYLNATPIRWLHYVRHRDARQGMPQMKIGHLRATPAPPDAWLISELSAFGELLDERNTGMEEDLQEMLDEMVAQAFHLTGEERELVTRWWKELT